VVLLVLVLCSVPMLVLVLCSVPMPVLVLCLLLVLSVSSPPAARS
jgi:hypothetical protein